MERKPIMTCQGVKFDDYVNDDMGVLTFVCDKCAVKHSFTHSMLGECDEPLICGVVGCVNKSDYYLNIVKLETRWSR